MKQALIVLFLFAAAVPVRAQERPLSLDEALSITLSNNPAMQAAQFEELAARQERRAAVGLRMPSIQIGGVYTYLGKDIGFDLNGAKRSVQDLAQTVLQSGVVPSELVPQIEQLISPLLGSDWRLVLQNRSVGFVGGEVTMPLFLGGKINVANRAARLNEQTAVASGRQTIGQLVSELVQRYYGLALARQVVAVRRQVVEGMRVHLRDAVALEENGMLARTERLYVQYKLAEAERELQNAELELKTIRQALGSTLARQEEFAPVTAMFVLDGIEGVDYYKQTAAHNSPLLDQVALKRKLAEENVKLQRADFLPQIAAMGGGTFYNYQVTDALPRWAVGVGVSIKIFDGLSREYKYSAAKQTARRVERLQSKAEHEISVLVEQLYNRMMTHAAQLVSIESSIRFAEEYLRSKNAAFLEGMGSSTDLIDAELNLAKVRTERMQAAYNFDLLLARLLEAAGISDRYLLYLRRPQARYVLFEQPLHP